MRPEVPYLFFPRKARSSSKQTVSKPGSDGFDCVEFWVPLVLDESRFCPRNAVNPKSFGWAPIAEASFSPSIRLGRRGLAAHGTSTFSLGLDLIPGLLGATCFLKVVALDMGVELLIYPSMLGWLLDPRTCHHVFTMQEMPRRRLRLSTLKAFLRKYWKLLLLDCWTQAILPAAIVTSLSKTMALCIRSSLKGDDTIYQCSSSTVYFGKLKLRPKDWNHDILLVRSVTPKLTTTFDHAQDVYRRVCPTCAQCDGQRKKLRKAIGGDRPGWTWSERDHRNPMSLSIYGTTATTVDTTFQNVYLPPQCFSGYPLPWSFGGASKGRNGNKNGQASYM